MAVGCRRRRRCGAGRRVKGGQVGGGAGQWNWVVGGGGGAGQRWWVVGGGGGAGQDGTLSSNEEEAWDSGGGPEEKESRAGSSGAS